ncbi:MAG: cell wall hydrolase [Acetatifactor muris]|nr:cell wall hydrolase [Acetatifactor muris]MCM1559678.1 cell wall hydrolase [Butyrivibrio sp.]
MRRKKLAKLLFGLKILAICGAAVFMVKGVGEFYADAGKEEETEEVKVTEESVTAEPETEAVLEIEENEVAERQSAEAVVEYQSGILSMDWDAEESYLLEKIAMAEAEGEDVEGKALVMLVVLNRVWSDKFPDTIEEVIYQRTGNGGWQFSPLQEGGRWYTTEPDQECREALELIQTGKWDESQGALYFESEGKSDWHRKNLEFLFQHGNHYFYTDKERVG